MNIQLKNIEKSFHLPGRQKLKVLVDISLTVPHGSFTVILGESGSGKSTLLNLIAGLSKPSVGQVIANDQNITGPDPSRSMIFQTPSLLPWLTVEENISFGCRLRGDTSNLSQRVNELIAMTGLQGFEKSHPTELSLGMAQRVSLARALIGKAKILLMDEPFGSLDSINRTRLQSELINIWQRIGYTGILVTHDIEEAVAMAQQIVLLGGRPSSIQKIIDIDLPYPRDLTGEDFFKARSKVLQELHKAYEQKL